MSSCPLITLAKPCASCPWRVNKDATDIPNFDLDLAEGLPARYPAQGPVALRQGERQLRA